MKIQTMPITTSRIARAAAAISVTMMAGSVRSFSAVRQPPLWPSLSNPAAFACTCFHHHPSRAMGKALSSSHATQLRMGLFDAIGDFLSDRKGDFIKLDSARAEFGPGPAILLYNVPRGIDDAEIMDMLADGAPQASAKGIVCKRLSSTSKLGDLDGLLEKPLQEALEDIVARKSDQEALGESQTLDALQRSPLLVDDDDADDHSAGTADASQPNQRTPILLFSGFQQSEMMESYNIIGSEIYRESLGTISLACAMAVPNAMQKPLGQVLEEIGGDHLEAMSSGGDDSDRDDASDGNGTQR